MTEKVKVETSSIFDRSLKKLKKKHYKLDKLFEAISVLIENDKQKLISYRDHALVGDYKGYRELHIESDWLLVYRFTNNRLELYLLDTGTHDDLFK